MSLAAFSTEQKRSRTHRGAERAAQAGTHFARCANPQWDRRVLFRNHSCVAFPSSSRLLPAHASHMSPNASDKNTHNLPSLCLAPLFPITTPSHAGHSPTPSAPNHQAPSRFLHITYRSAILTRALGKKPFVCSVYVHTDARQGAPVCL